MTLRLPRFEQSTPLVDENGLPTVTFHRWWQAVANALEEAFNNLEEAVAAIAAAQAAADAANAAAAAADAAAANAQTTADGITNTSELSTSYVTSASPPIISATDAGTDVTVTIGNHFRNYPQPDGSVIQVSVTGGTITGLSYDTFYYFYYDDAARLGGSVTFHATTSAETAAQIGDRHTVGGLRTPLAGDPDVSGINTDPPGTWGVRDNQ